MINTYEVTLYTSVFNNFTNNPFVIIEDQGFKAGDYILFKQVESIGDEVKETGLHRMTQVTSVMTDEGLKEGYVILTVNKL